MRSPMNASTATPSTPIEIFWLRVSFIRGLSALCGSVLRGQIRSPSATGIPIKQAARLLRSRGNRPHQRDASAAVFGDVQVAAVGQRRVFANVQRRVEVRPTGYARERVIDAAVVVLQLDR